MTLRMLKLPHEVKLLATLPLAQDLLQIKFNQCVTNRIFKLTFEWHFEAKFRRLFSESFFLTWSIWFSQSASFRNLSTQISSLKCEVVVFGCAPKLY